MPELPEVEVTLQGLQPHIEKSTLNEVVIRTHKLRYLIPDNLKTTLTNQQLTSIKRRGKYLIFSFEKSQCIVHLGMSGSLRIVEKKSEWRKHDHWHWQFESAGIRYHDPRRFGFLTWLEDRTESIRKMGVEPLEKTFTGHFLYEVCKNSKRAIKSLIMDQKIIVGVGNIYANEVLFLSKIHPSQKACMISKEKCISLCVNLQNTLRTAIKVGGSTLKDFVNPDGTHGYFSQKIHVYALCGESCTFCKSKIERIIIGNRSTFFCPNCQKIHS